MNGRAGIYCGDLGEYLPRRRGPFLLPALSVRRVCGCVWGGERWKDALQLPARGSSCVGRVVRVACRGVGFLLAQASRLGWTFLIVFSQSAAKFLCSAV